MKSGRKTANINTKINLRSFIPAKAHCHTLARIARVVKATTRVIIVIIFICSDKNT